MAICFVNPFNPFRVVLIDVGYPRDAGRQSLHPIFGTGRECFVRRRAFWMDAGRKSQGTNLKFQIGDFRGEKSPDSLCQCKYMISRRLGPFFTFSTPFLSRKGLISRRLQRKGGLFGSDALFHEYKLTQGRRGAEAQSKRRIKRSKVGLGGSLSGIKWDYAGRKLAASRLIPDNPAYSRVMRFVIFWGRRKRRRERRARSAAPYLPN